MQKSTLRKVAAIASIVYLVLSSILVTITAVTGLARLLHLVSSPPTNLNDAVQQMVHYDANSPEGKEELEFALGSVGLLYGVILIAAICAWLFFKPAIRRFVAARKARTI